jgi:hypothetical protein
MLKLTPQVYKRKPHVKIKNRHSTKNGGFFCSILNYQMRGKFNYFSDIHQQPCNLNHK